MTAKTFGITLVEQHTITIALSPRLEGRPRTFKQTFLSKDWCVPNTNCLEAFPLCCRTYMLFYQLEERPFFAFCSDTQQIFARHGAETVTSVRIHNFLLSSWCRWWCSFSSCQTSSKSRVRHVQTGVNIKTDAFVIDQKGHAQQDYFVPSQSGKCHRRS